MTNPKPKPPRDTYPYSVDVCGGSHAVYGPSLTNSVICLDQDDAEAIAAALNFAAQYRKTERKIKGLKNEIDALLGIYD